MTHETLTNPLFVAAYISAIFTIAVFISFSIIYLQDHQAQKKLDQMDIDFAARIAADKKKHSDFMAGIEAITKESDAKLLAMKTCRHAQRAQSIQFNYGPIDFSP
jgi:amino acid permease